ncbi:1,4-dihydroxy-2-naphthoate octaprenyltransferase [Spongiivirga citrea]|uniref:1,4-dihydroxy-2-naphthoate octaprenyltransferase n=1 Tax=Spongiivirga citrea TaxID=1481457 RepID=A0A6M0CF57_9FLAO|nr:1,4-dihydroxy-2-naphthoate octaprenyltransferase [Spongiivirga citrea]NER16475.1 1,4-dihydroxy-2-naphthoate octaprenyltransferase [Spongiivirga citrea]
MSQSKTKAWLSAARLRTLPLSVSGIITGTALAYNEAFNSIVFVLAIITTILFQILSNFANDYGDGVKGTDNENRIGPKRAVQSGIISKAEMKKGVIITALFSLLAALSLIYSSFGIDYLLYILVFTVLAIVAIIAAIKYTVGDSAYGYNGLGDVFVFIFFGLVAVGGSYFLYTKRLDLIILFPATAIGLLSVAVLNLNNMRDEDSDRSSNKNTIVVKFGGRWARKFHLAIIGIAFVAISYYCWKTFDSIISLLPIIAFIPLAIHLIKIRKIQLNGDLDPELKKVALSTFLLSLLLMVKMIFS